MRRCARSALYVTLLALAICIPGCVFWTHYDGYGDVAGYVFVSGSQYAPGWASIHIGMDPPDGYVPWAFASVEVVGTNLRTDTDAYGRFALSGVPAGMRTLYISDGTRHSQYEYGQPPSAVVLGGAAPDTRSWTVMIYMIADNNLGRGSWSYMAQDLNEMETAYFDSSDISVLAFVDPPSVWPAGSDYLVSPGYEGARVYEITRDASGSNQIVSPVVASPRDQSGAIETDSADPEALRSFVNWCKTFYPASRYALILWDHGDGIAIHNDPDSRVVQSRAIGPDEGLPAGPGKGFMDVDQIAHALSGLEVDLIGFDACLMGGIEVVYELRGCADVIVASEEAEPGPGWDYSDALTRLSTAYDAWQCGIELVESYADEHKNYSGALRILTCSAVRTSEVEELVDRVDSLSQALDAALSDPPAWAGVREGLMDALSGSTRFGYIPGNRDYQYHYYDLASLCEEICYGVSLSGWGLPRAQAAQVADSAYGVLQWFEAAEAAGCLHSREIGDTGSYPCSGLSIYCAPPDTWNSDNPGYNYGQCEFARRTRWFEVMSRL